MIKRGLVYLFVLCAVIVSIVAGCGERGCPECKDIDRKPKPAPTVQPTQPPLPSPVPPGPSPEPTPVDPLDATPQGFLSQDEVVKAFLAMQTGAPIELAPFDAAAEERLASVKAAGDLTRHLRPIRYDGRHTGLSLQSRTARDLRAFDTPIKNQGSRGTCTAFATIGVVEHMVKEKFSKTVDLSEDHLWSCYQRPYTQGAINCAMKLFVTDEAHYPYSPTRFVMRNVTADMGVANEGKFEEVEPAVGSVVQTVLEERLPVVFALDVNSAFMRTGKTGAVNPFDRSVVGGHAVGIVGAVKDSRLDGNFGGGYFIIRNSWAASQGDHGYNYLPLIYCQTHTCYEAYKPSLDSLKIK